jgi:hypothetical protein
MYGDHPQLSAYQTRFPGQYPEFSKLVQAQPLPTVVTNSPTAPPVAPATPVNSGTEHLSAIAITATNLGATDVEAEPPKPKPAQLTVGSTTSPLGGATGMIGDYKMIKRIGSGGFGEVWRAEAPGGVECAIKIIFRPIDHDEAQRELQSLELIKALRHPYLLATQRYQQMEDRLVIIMELADGSLRDRLKECRKNSPPGIPLPELIGYFREAAEALDYLHKQRVLHRDIKPDNILTLARHAKLADFGLARLTQASVATVSGSGTPAYMAPEVWRGKVSEHSDQYALAATWGELRLDRRLFTSRDMMEIMLDHIERTPELKPLSEAEQQVILRGLAKNAHNRFPSCMAFVEALEDALAPELGASGARRRGPATVPEGSLVSRPPTGPVTLPGTEAGGLVPVTNVHPATAPDGSVQQGAYGTSSTQPITLKPVMGRRSFLKLAALVALGSLIVSGGVVTMAKLRNKPDNGGGSGDQPAEVRDDVAPPTNCVPGAGAKVVTIQGVDLWDRINYILPDGTPIPFVLIPKKLPGDPPTFYMMVNKVSNELFEKVPGAAAPNSQWRKGGLANRVDVTDKDPRFPRLPVLRVTVDEANNFAKSLGGRLPSAFEWDKAAGLFDYKAEKKRGIRPTSRGPYLDANPEPTGPDAIAVNRVVQGPKEVGTATNDISRYGCHDMAGNGREFTRTLQLEDGREVPIPDPPDACLVLLRGKSYALPKPLVFSDLESDFQKESQPYKGDGSASPVTGFRVVIELNVIR